MSLRSEIKALLTKVADMLRSHEYRLRDLEARSAFTYDDVEFESTTLIRPVPDQKIYRPDGTLALRIVHQWEEIPTSGEIAHPVFQPVRLVGITRLTFDLTGQNVVKQISFTFNQEDDPFKRASQVNIQQDKSKGTLT